MARPKAKKPKATEKATKNLADIRRIFGAAHAAYARRKNTGGTNNAKGVAFEDLFAAHKMVELAVDYMCTDVDWLLEAQVCSFVDDLVLTPKSGTNAVFAFQLKNSPSVKWGSGFKSISRDFENQYRLSCSQGFAKVELSLVGSDAVNVSKLQNVPASISSHTKVVHFPYGPTVHRWLMMDPQLVTHVGRLSRSANPGVIDAEQVMQVLIGTWATVGREGDLSSIVDRARQISPTIIRPLRSDADAVAKLRPSVKVILDSIDGFTYSIKKGFLQWSCCGTEGTLRFDCFDPAFDQFQDYLERDHPHTFDEIEGCLL